jgi:hypothetical protein
MHAFRHPLGCALLALTLSVTALACGDDTAGSAEADCGADVQGSVYTFDEGSATVTGTVTLPPSAEDGWTINLMVMEEGGSAKYGVVPDFSSAFGGEIDACPADWATHGPTFTYEITLLNAGSYQLHLKLKDDDDEVYDQTAEAVITVTDGAQMTHDEVFSD